MFWIRFFHCLMKINIYIHIYKINSQRAFQSLDFYLFKTRLHFAYLVSPSAVVTQSHATWIHFPDRDALVSHCCSTQLSVQFSLLISPLPTYSTLRYQKKHVFDGFQELPEYKPASKTEASVPIMDKLKWILTSKTICFKGHFLKYNGFILTSSGKMFLLLLKWIGLL